jgi:hypothetical protein
MKKLLLSILFLFMFCSQAFGAWTVTASKVFETEHYIYVKWVCVSDGTTLTSTNLLVSSTSAEAVVTIGTDLFRRISGTTAMVLDVIPGTGGAAPTATMDFTFANELITFFNETAFSNVADTPGTSMAIDYGQYPVISGQLNLTSSDIGDAVDQVTLAILCWKEDK